ncbi:MAG: helix-turn-helix transcriptional regulator [Actinomycetota bacterium]|nr:helix-turn-helix transcriptional regulator [Actinomycetota bacterium]
MSLKVARIKAGLGRRRASRRIGMGVSQLYRYEAGLRRPGIEAVMRISRGLELDDPWQIAEFQTTLEQAEALGLPIAPAHKNGHTEEQE